MKVSRFAFLLMLVLFMTILSTSQALANTYVWIVLGPPSFPPSPGSTITTDLRVSSWNGAAGALDLVIRYDPTVIKNIGFSIPTNSSFSSNCYAYSPPDTPGQTKIACFQVANWKPQETPIILGTLTWKVIGQNGSATDLKIESPTVVASDWSPVEVLVYGQRITIAPFRIYLPALQKR
jgi:hypothetical protein